MTALQIIAATLFMAIALPFAAVVIAVIGPKVYNAARGYSQLSIPSGPMKPTPMAGGAIFVPVDGVIGRGALVHYAVGHDGLDPDRLLREVR